MSNQIFTPASKDIEKILLWLIDEQFDFVDPRGSLYVPGAEEDMKRLLRWFKKSSPKITKVASSLDTHYLIQIFFKTWWINSNGEHPEPYTVITSDDVKTGKWSPIYAPKTSLEYLQKLETKGKKNLIIWPFHCLDGTPGRSLVPELFTALQEHSLLRNTEPYFLVKGTIPTTEFYSVLEPEVEEPRHPQGSLNTDFLDFVGKYDKIIITGQAKSHCVMETMNSVMNFFQGDQNTIKKIFFLEDCTSSIPGFEDATEKAFSDFSAKGLNIINTKDFQL